MPGGDAFENTTGALVTAELHERVSEFRFCSLSERLPLAARVIEGVDRLLPLRTLEKIARERERRRPWSAPVEIARRQSSRIATMMCFIRPPEFDGRDEHRSAQCESRPPF
jgi:hypothetical protein